MIHASYYANRIDFVTIARVSININFCCTYFEIYRLCNSYKHILRVYMYVHFSLAIKYNFFMNNFRHQIPVYCNTAIKLIKLPPSMTSCITAASGDAYETQQFRYTGHNKMSRIEIK